eukprot:891177-Prorocentrum_lima.AAC.1
MAAVPTDWHGNVADVVKVLGNHIRHHVSEEPLELQLGAQPDLANLAAQLLEYQRGLVDLVVSVQQRPPTTSSH